MLSSADMFSLEKFFNQLKRDIVQIVCRTAWLPSEIRSVNSHRFSNTTGSPVAYKRPPSIKDKLIRAKVPNTSIRPRRIVPGMQKCNNCPICPFVDTGKTVKATAINYKIDINTQVNCQTRNIIYCITCSKCRVQYVGESERTLQDRFSDHRGI